MRIIAPVWLAFVLVISLMPVKLKYRVGTTGILHNPGHFVVFFITAVLLCREAPGFGSRLLRWTGICCFAALTEVLESATYHNAMEWRDLLVDLLGAAVGLAVVSLFHLGSTHVESGEIGDGEISRSHSNL